LVGERKGGPPDFSNMWEKKRVNISGFFEGGKGGPVVKRRRRKLGNKKRRAAWPANGVHDRKATRLSGNQKRPQKTSKKGRGGIATRGKN